MKNKKERLQLIVNLVKKNSIGSQNELAQMLEKNGCRVTQATLSRDLKSMKITKVATNDGGYMYIIPDTNKIHDSMLMSGQRSMTAHQQVGFISIKFSGNIAVIKTRNGYAAGLALGHGFGRIGCLMAGCCHGIASEHGIYFPELGHKALPTQLYEALFLFALAAFLWRIVTHTRGLGPAVYFTAYGIWSMMMYLPSSWISACERTVMCPRPVVYACTIPLLP